jgi:ribosome biogenesis GTPase
LNQLKNLGWDASLASAFGEAAREGQVPARVSAQEREGYKVIAACGEYPASMTGRLHHNAHHTEDLPTVGDWVAVDVHADSGFARIHGILPRKTALLRKLSNGRVFAPQVVASNFDVVFIATSANRDFNPRRIERMLTLVWESGATPVVLVTKIDLVDDAASFVDRAQEIAWGAPVHAVSAHAGVGVEQLEPYIGVGRTVVFLGTSGVGKSTLTNRLLGEDRMFVNAVRADDDRGRHTTTSRNLLPLRGGGAIIDTPGLRAVSLWDSEEGMEATFGDIEELAGNCRFGDCGHGSEPGCAVNAAVAGGQLSEDRLASYFKLQREIAHVQRKQNRAEASNAKRRFKTLSRDIRRNLSERRREWGR